MNTASKKYISICNALGFEPGVAFVKINTNGSVCFTCGKPDEIRSLARAVEREGMTMSKALRAAAKR